MGGFVQGFGQGAQNVRDMQNDIATRRQQAELFKLKSKQMKLETDMTEKQLAAQSALPEMLFKPPQQQEVQAQGPGVGLPPTDPAHLASFSPQEIEAQQHLSEGPQPTGMADIAGTGGPMANVSPELKNIFQNILVSTGGDMAKTMATIQALAPNVFPQQPFVQKLGEGETLQQVDPRSGQSRMLAQGNPKYRAPISVRAGGTVFDPTSGQPLFTAPESDKPEKPVVVPSGGILATPEGMPLLTNEKQSPDNMKADIVEVGGVPHQVVMEDGKKVLKELPGTPTSAGKSPINPVDQYVFAHSDGKYRNMAEAAAAGETALIREAEKIVREQRPMERAEAQARVMTAESAIRGRESEQIKLEQPLEQEKRANLYDRKAFATSGKLVRLPPGTSKGAAAKADVIEITDKQLAEVQGLDNATMDMETLFKMGDKLITAKNWKDATFKQYPSLKGGAFSGFNSDAATYEKDVQAFSTNLARSFGHEKGVLTDQDIARWVATIPTFRDTVQTKEKKKAVFHEIKDNALKAQRRVIAGDDLETVRSELQQTIQPLLRKADGISAVNGAPPVPEHYRSRPKDEQELWQQTYMDRMNEMGAEQ